MKNIKKIYLQNKEKNLISTQLEISENLKLN